MEELENKYDTINIITSINELIVQTEVTQCFKNTKSSPIELQMTIPKLANNNLTRFEMTMNNQKVISKIIENGKAKEKYTDTIATGNYGFLSYNTKEETTICLGNIPPDEEIELKSYFFGHITTKDYSYQACFPVIFPGFILGDPKNEENPKNYEYKKQIVKGKIYIDTFSKLTRLVIKGSNNFGKIERKYGSDYKSAEIDIYKDNFNDKDIPGIILFRTEEINENKIFFQYDSLKEKNVYILQKTYEIPKFNLNLTEKIDENENINYASLLEKNNKNKNNNKKCYIFLLDQSGSMSGSRMELCIKALLLFLQSLNEDCLFQLIGFGSNFEYYTKEPVEYNKENIKNLMDLIKNLSANKGGTELYSPLNDIYNNNIYEKYDMIKHIFLLTDGEISEKEKTLNLIGSHSNDFYFHSLGIGSCDKDLIERSAILGNGYSYYINDLEELNKIIISALDKSQSEMKVECECNQKGIIEEKKQKYIKLNDHFRHGVISDENINNISFQIKCGEKDEKIELKNLEIIKLPDGEELGKLIVDNYLTENKSLDFRTKIKLSKDYNILCSETAFYAEIQNEVPVTQKMTVITNQNKEAINNNLMQEINLRNIGYENKAKYFNINNNNNINNTNSNSNNNNDEIKGNKKSFLSRIFSIFSCKRPSNKIINKKNYELKENPKNIIIESESDCNILNSINSDRICNNNLNRRNIKRKHNIKNERRRDLYDDFISCKKNVNYCDNIYYNISNNCIKESCCLKESNEKIESKKKCCKDSYFNSCQNKDYDCDIINNNISCKCIKESDDYSSKEDNKIIENKKKKKKKLNFDDVILSQDIIEGNWKRDNQIEILIEEEKEIFEKIQKYSENKGIKDENGIITLFILYYIIKKKSEKVEELKFVIDKAKNYIKKIYNLECDEIIKEFDSY